MNMKKRSILLVLLALMLFAAACGMKQETPEQATTQTETTTGQEPQTEEVTTEEEKEPAAAEKNGEVYILYTSDVHCGIDNGFGYAGLKQIRDSLESQGYTTLLVDDGDSIQGQPVGTLTKGEAIIDLMNALHYDAAIPGNHEFDYDADYFVELTKKADFPYISCNFNHQGELVFAPYVIKEAAGLKIAFVGVTTPTSLHESSPSHFMNAEGEFVYGFLEDKTGQALYTAVQDAVDDARAEGADLVYVMGHCGLEVACEPWTYADIISHTRGIDVFLDGHSHDTEQVVMKNADGEEVTRSACGTELNCIGYSHISADGTVAETGIFTWPNKVSAPELFGIENEICEEVKKAQDELKELLGEVIASTPFDLTINDPVEKDASGNPIRMVRRAETNLGDLCADAFRTQGQADIGFVNGGGVRANVKKGDITYGDILSIHPFGNMLTVVEVTGQDVIDALEWSVRAVPNEEGSFLQVSGLSFEVDASIDSPCIKGDDESLKEIVGERRVRNVMVGGEPIDPEKTYTVASHDYMLLQIADGYSMFRDKPVLQQSVTLDNQLLIDYIRDTLGGVVPEEYADPYGQGRIVFLNGEGEE